MTPDCAGVALAAGEGSRLRPLTSLRPKALCPVNGRPLVDLALERLEPLTGGGPEHLAVNAFHFAELVEEHCRDRALVSVETGEALGTAGAVAKLRPWIDGRPVLVTNADSYLPGGLGNAATGFAAGWDGERCRLLCRPTAGKADFTAADGSGLQYIGACLLPWARVRDLPLTPCGLYEVLWRDDVRAGTLDLVTAAADAVAIDCGTPGDYLAANLHASGGRNVIGPGAVVRGRLERSVVWDGAWVGPGEILTDAVRAGTRHQPLTVQIRP